MVTRLRSSLISPRGHFNARTKSFPVPAGIAEKAIFLGTTTFKTQVHRVDTGIYKVVIFNFFPKTIAVLFILKERTETFLEIFSFRFT